MAVEDDDDPSDVTVSIADASGEEGGEVRFTVTLSKAVNHDVRVWWESEFYFDADYPPYPALTGEFWYMDGWLEFSAGETTQTAEVFLNDDPRREWDEVFLVTLSKPQGATIANARGVMTIIDND